jgi:hypothetical protein
MNDVQPVSCLDICLRIIILCKHLHSYCTGQEHTVLVHAIGQQILAKHR